MQHVRETRGRIIVLDDDPDLREEIGQFLSAHGHPVIGLEDGSTIAATDFAPSDILVLDMVLLGMDGTDVLFGLTTTAHPPRIVLITGHGEPVLRAAAAAAERAGLTVLAGLQKPFDLFALEALLRSAREVAPCSIYVPPAASDIRNALDAALDEDTLPVEYQPIVRSKDLSFCGAEALLAGWLPGLGQVSPIDIINAIEGDRALIARLTENVAQQAAVACRTWTRAGWSGTVSINAPIEALTQPKIVTSLLSVVEAAGIEPHQLILELTENGLYDSSFAALQSLLKLRIAGFRLALDDVGQRQSGLLQLANLPVTEIKIDMELIRAARTWSKGRGIYESLAHLGRRLDLAIVAEGIENLDDMALVRANQVDYVQGYLISKKRPLPELIAMLPEMETNLGYATLERSAG